MKAYGIEAEEVLDGVMSKINIVGNTAATSNAEIISGLQNSASAMAAMNSTLEENIALFTAAQEITQDDSNFAVAFHSNHHILLKHLLSIDKLIYSVLVFHQ